MDNQGNTTPQKENNNAIRLRSEINEMPNEFQRFWSYLRDTRETDKQLSEVRKPVYDVDKKIQQGRSKKVINEKLCKSN